MAREARGLQGCQAARQFRRSPSRWSRYETGADTMPLRLLMRVAVAWGMPRIVEADPDIAALLRAARTWRGPDGPDDAGPASARRIA